MVCANLTVLPWRRSSTGVRAVGSMGAGVPFCPSDHLPTTCLLCNHLRPLSLLPSVAARRIPDVWFSTPSDAGLRGTAARVSLVPAYAVQGSGSGGEERPRVTLLPACLPAPAFLQLHIPFYHHYRLTTIATTTLRLPAYPPSAITCRHTCSFLLFTSPLDESTKVDDRYSSG